ncbi:MAG: hypothetical protein ACREMO_03700 [Gemmatimonadales bacterium]
MLRVFVNQRPVEVPVGADAAAAVQAFDPALGSRLAEGTAHLTDGRGIRITGEARLEQGAILRVVESRRRPADAHPEKTPADPDADE